ncbi:MAG: endonuclease/exonuclease/phosphatase family protein [Candidatus Omnitrophica bacterium]|nr:endonuclease/exonuclease/phosphatase family protein [Candidatus Omnitrophota bacterium]
MKILSLNTWQECGPWRERWELIFQGLEECGPDIVAFQEIFNPDWVREIQKRSGIPYLVFPPEHSGLMVLSRFPVNRWMCLTMKTQSPTENYFRYALFADLDILGTRLAIFNTHLSWKLNESLIRVDQVEELLGFIDAHASGVETAVMGDFNATADTPEIRKMTREGNFIDTYAFSNPQDPGITWNNRNPYTAGPNPPMPDRRIDYIFIRNRFRLLAGLESVRLVLNRPGKSGIWPSDHAALLATFHTQGSVLKEKDRRRSRAA